MEVKKIEISTGKNNKLEIENKNTIENEQKNFIETTLGKTINYGLNTGLRFLLPDFIEDQIIEIKETLLKNGLKEGINKAIEEGINLGKSAVGIFTGKFENISQVQNVIKNGGMIDSISNIMDKILNKTMEKSILPKEIGTIIKQGKNIILDNVSKNIENEFEKQLDSLEKVSKYTNNWEKYYKEKDFEGMDREYRKIKEKMKDLIPIENTIKKVRQVENLHSFIKNNGKNFNITKEEMELTKILL